MGNGIVKIVKQQNHIFARFLKIRRRILRVHRLLVLHYQILQMEHKELGNMLAQQENAI